MGKVGGAWKATCLHRKRRCGAPSPRDHQSCARMEVRRSLLLLLALKTLWAGEHEGETEAWSLVSRGLWMGEALCAGKLADASDPWETASKKGEHTQ